MKPPRLFSGGTVCTGLLGLAGVWLVLAPFWVGYQTAGTTWLRATHNDVVVGAVLVVSSLLGLFGQVAFGLRDAALWVERDQRAAAATGAQQQEA